jgi:hypothetical protein
VLEQLAIDFLTKALFVILGLVYSKPIH